jgi:hypothetical protein
MLRQRSRMTRRDPVYLAKSGEAKQAGRVRDDARAGEDAGASWPEAAAQ